MHLLGLIREFDLIVLLSECSGVNDVSLTLKASNVSRAMQRMAYGIRLVEAMMASTKSRVRKCKRCKSYGCASSVLSRRKQLHPLTLDELDSRLRIINGFMEGDIFRPQTGATSSHLLFVDTSPIDLKGYSGSI